MNILPPSFKFDGDQDKAISLKAYAGQFYRLITTQAAKEGVPHVTRTKRFPDGTIINFKAQKNSLFKNWSGRVEIYAAPVSISELIKPSQVLIHGFIIDDVGARVLNSEFIVHSPSFTGRFSNPIYLTDFNTLATSPKYPDTTRRLTFARYNENSPNDFILFGGPSNPESARNLTNSENVCDGIGKFYYQGLLYEPASTDVIYDARVKGTTIHVLRGRYTSASLRWTLTYSTYTVGDINSKIDWTTFLIDPVSSFTFRIRGQSLEVPSQQAATALITILSEDVKTPMPTGSSSSSGAFTVHFADARFDLECTTISMLASGRLNFNMTGGGVCYFHTNVDLVHRIEPLAIMDSFTLVSDAYLENTTDIPRTYVLYKNQYSRIKKTTTFSNITVNHYLNNAKEWYDALFIQETVIGPGGVFETLADWQAYLDLYDPVAHPGSFWNGDAFTIFSDPNSSSGVARRTYFDSADGLTHTHQSNVCGRTQKKYAYSTGQIDVSLLGESTFYCGYSFDLDEASITYNSRTFVEIGYKTETNPEGRALPFVNTIAWKVVWDTQINDESLIGDAALPIFTAEVMAYYNDGKQSTSSITPVTTGVLSKGIWVGSQLINRIGSMYAVQTGLNEQFLRKMELRIIPDATGYPVGVSDGDAVVEGDIYHLYRDPAAFDFTTPAYPYRHIWNMNYNFATGIRIGHTDYDRKTGCFYITSFNNDTYRKNTSPVSNFAGNESLVKYNTKHLTDERPVSTLSKVVVVDGEEIAYQSVHEPWGSWSEGGNPSITTTTSLSGSGFLGTSMIRYSGTSSTPPANTTTYIDSFQNPLSIQGGVYLTNNNSEYVVSIPYSENGVNSTAFPTKLSEIPRGSIEVISPSGTIIGQSLIFPDGSTPNTPIADWKRTTKIGVTGVET